MSQAQLAEACGWKSQSRVGNYEVGTREPTLADIDAMAKALGVQFSDVLPMIIVDESHRSSISGNSPLPANVGLTATPKKTSATDIVREMLEKNGSLSEHLKNKILAVAENTSEEDSNVIPADLSGLRARPDEILIPQYDIRGAMGHGQVPADYNEAIRNLIVREEVLREKGVTYTSTAALAVITGWGQSMEGTINDKDPVVVDRGVNEFIGEGIYVITWHGLLYIKRLQMVDEDHYRMISDNRHYENQTARIDDVTIHAKVLLVWNAQKL